MIDMNNKAFTLIELIVAISIIAILSGMSLVSYTQFNIRQSAQNDGRGFETELRKVQAMAKNLVYPENNGTRCESLSKYIIKSDESGISCNECQFISASAICGNGEFVVLSHDKVFTKAFFSGDLNIDIEPGTGIFTVNYVFPINNINDMVLKTDENGNINVQ